MKAGPKRYLYSFQVRENQGEDSLGNKKTYWVEQFKQLGSRVYMRAGEEVIAARLQGIKRAFIGVFQSENMDKVCPDWRMVDVRSGIEYNIRDVMSGDKDREYTLLVESGVADG